MAKQYYIKKDPAVSGPDIEWTALNGKEFYQLITSPAGKGRYFIDMDDFMIEASETEYAEWRREKNHSDYLRKQEKEIQMLSLHTDMYSEDGVSKEDIRDQGTDTEAEAIASIVRRALNTALNSLDPESYLIIDTLILSPGDKRERDLASEFGLSQKAINKRKKKILENLKKLVLKLEKSQQ